MTDPRVVVVGLGPAGTELVLPAALDALRNAPVRLVRTARHPAVAELAQQGVDLEPLDACYDDASDIDAAYTAIVERVVDAARTHGEVAYAVPGSATVAEKTVALLRARRDVRVEIVPGLSFVDLAWQRLGFDPMGGARVVDARTLDVDVAGFAGAMLIAQCDTRDACSEVKLVLLEDLPADHPVTVLQRLGGADERVFTVALAELDRDPEFVPDHLTTLFVDTGKVSVAGALARLVALTERLRGPGGCPWDAAQTHHSLRRHVLEEAYEVADAIDGLPPYAPSHDVMAESMSIASYDALEDELGDLLFQVMIHSVLAAEAGAFTIADVANRIHAKLVHRHPHVFGTVDAATPDAVVTNWEQIKMEERGSTSLVERITPGLPALLYAQKLLRKAASVGLDAVEDADVAVTDEQAFGDALAALVVAGARAGLDAESALASWDRRFRDRFVRMEELAIAARVDLAGADRETVERLWQAAAASGPSPRS